MKPALEALARENTDLALRIIDIESWESPAWEEASRKYRPEGIPYIRVYGKDGKFLGEATGDDLEQIKRLIQRGQKP